MKWKRLAVLSVIVLAGVVAGLAVTAAQAPSTAGISSMFDPPLTARELAEYRKISADKAAVQKFVATRLFMREIAVYKSELPQGAEYDSVKHGSPQPGAKVDIDYALTFDEQLLIYSACLMCGGCGDKDENAPTGHPLCGLRHPKQFDCGTPVDRATVLSQLTPPSSPDEIRLFEKANTCPLPEMPRFLATRQYMRKIQQLKAAVPAGKTFDAHTAPPTPRLLDATYFLSDEIDLMMEIQMVEVERLSNARK